MTEAGTERTSAPGTPVKLGAVGGKEPCPCGSGKKYKACCYRKDLAAGTTGPLAAPPQVSENQAGAGELEAEARPSPKAKPPLPGKQQALPPRKPPQGAAKALNRRSGHR